MGQPFSNGPSWLQGRHGPRRRSRGPFSTNAPRDNSRTATAITRKLWPKRSTGWRRTDILWTKQSTPRESACAQDVTCILARQLCYSLAWKSCDVRARVELCFRALPPPLPQPRCELPSPPTVMRAAPPPAEFSLSLSLSLTRPLFVAIPVPRCACGGAARRRGPAAGRRGKSRAGGEEQGHHRRWRRWRGHVCRGQQRPHPHSRSVVLLHPKRASCLDKDPTLVNDGCVVVYKGKKRRAGHMGRWGKSRAWGEEQGYRSRRSPAAVPAQATRPAPNGSQE